VKFTNLRPQERGNNAGGRQPTSFEKRGKTAQPLRRRRGKKKRDLQKGKHAGAGERDRKSSVCRTTRVYVCQMNKEHKEATARKAIIFHQNNTKKEVNISGVRRTTKGREKAFGKPKKGGGAVQHNQGKLTTRNLISAFTKKRGRSITGGFGSRIEWEGRLHTISQEGDRKTKKQCPSKFESRGKGRKGPIATKRGKGRRGLSTDEGFDVKRAAFSWEKKLKRQQGQWEKKKA